MAAWDTCVSEWKSLGETLFNLKSGITIVMMQQISMGSPEDSTQADQFTGFSFPLLFLTLL